MSVNKNGYTERGNIINNLIKAFERIKSALFNNNLNEADALLKKEVVPYITSGNNDLIYVILNFMTPYYESNNHQLMSSFLCIKGHLFYYLQVYDEAEKFYKKSISYATLYNQFGTLSAALNNLVIIRKKANVPENIFINSSKAIVLFQMMAASPNNEERVKRRAFVFLESLLKVNRNSEAESVLAFIERNYTFEVGSREFFQLKCIKAHLALEIGKYDLALKTLHNIFNQINTLQLHLDLVMELNETFAKFEETLKHSNISSEWLNPYLETLNLEKLKFKEKFLKSGPNKTQFNELCFEDFLQKGEQCLNDCKKITLYYIKNVDLFEKENLKQETFENIINNLYEAGYHQIVYTKKSSTTLMIFVERIDEYSDSLYATIENSLKNLENKMYRLYALKSSNKDFKSMEEAVRFLKATYYYSLK